MRMILLLICAGVLWPQTPASGDKCRIEGRVVNSVSGEPVRRVRVLANGQFAGGRGVAPGPNAARPPQYSTTTDAEGRFAFDAIEPGRYAVIAQRDGFGAASAQSGAARVPVSLAAGDKKTDVLLRLQPLSVIAGRIRDDQGDPLRRISVSAMSYQYSARGRQLVLRGSAITNDLGEYRIFDLGPGKYYLKATPQTPPAIGGRGSLGGGSPDEDVLAAAFYPGVLDAAAAVALDARPGEELSGIDLALRRVRGVAIRGRVMPPAGAMGVMSVSIEVDQILRAAAPADPQGNFELRGLAPGSYTLTSGAAVAGKRYSARVAVQVGSADIDGIELRMQAPVDVTGVVRVEGGGSPGQGQVRVALMSNRGLTSASVPRPGETGAFVVRNVEPGVYNVSITPGSPDQYVKSVRCGNSEVGETGIDLSGGAPCELSITLSASGGQIEGTVDREASSGTSVFVALIPAGSRRDPSLLKMSGVGEGGQFRFSGVAPGSYRLYAFEDMDVNAVRYDPEFLKPYESQGQSVQVAENSKQTVTVKVTQTGK